MTSDIHVLVTGASGLVGSHVMKELERRSVKATSLGRRSGSFIADLLSPDSLLPIPWDQFTHVVHCAAAIPARTDNFETNTLGTQNLLACLPKTLTSLVLVSSISATAKSEYGVSKLQAETLCEKWAQQNSTSLSIFRPTSIFGKGMAQNTILPVFVRLAMKNEPLCVTAPRDYRQNFVWAGDVATVLVDAAVGAKQGRWDLCSDDTMNAVQLAQSITSVYGGVVEDMRTQATGQPASFDNSALKAEFACEFTPFVSALRSSFEG